MSGSRGGEHRPRRRRTRPGSGAFGCGWRARRWCVLWRLAAQTSLLARGALGSLSVRDVARSGRSGLDATRRQDVDDLRALLSAAPGRRVRSVIVPSAISAAKPTVSDSVGWGWMVSAMSSALAPISSASTVSAISRRRRRRRSRRRAARCVPGSNSSLVMPFGAAQAERAAGGRPREHGLLVLDALGLGVGLGETHPRDLGVGVGDRRDRPRVELGARDAGDHLGGDLALVRGLVGEHRAADDVADRVDPVARWCASGGRRG